MAVSEVKVLELYLYTATSDGLTHEIRIDRDTASLQPTAAVKATVTPPTSAFPVKVGGSRRGRASIFARGFRLVRIEPAVNGFKQFFTFLPILNPADFAAGVKGDPFILSSGAFTLLSKVGEVSRGI
jgi:hypothetical protein